MKIANIFYAAAALSLSVAAAPAMAATVTSTPTPISAAGITDGSGFFGTSLSKGKFSDILTFSVAEAGGENLNLTFNASYISNLAASLNGEALVFSLTNAATHTYTGTVLQTLAAGPQTLTITGNALSATKSNYSGNLQFSAVPEPTSWALMVLGFGAAGIMLRRRRTAGNTGGVAAFV